MFYILLAILLGIVVYKINKLTKYWQDKNVDHEPAWPIVGNMGSVVLGKQHVRDMTIQLYRKHSDKRYVGLLQFTRPLLLIRDIEIIKQISIKNFDHFHDHYSFNTTESDPFVSKSLVFLTGKAWRQKRATLSPVFTSSKMRTMYHLISECAENFVSHFQGKEQVAVEMKDIFSRFGADVIASTAFGIKINTLDEPENNFYTMGKSLNRGIFQLAKIILLSKFPTLSKFAEAQLFPKQVTNFFRFLVKDNISKREKEGIVRPDMIHLLMEARKGQLKHESFKNNKLEGFASTEETNFGEIEPQMDLTNDDIAAQAMIFFFGGFDTTSTASCFCAYELALHPDIQKKLQKEIDDVNRKNEGKVSYESLLSMKYLDQVVCETLRLWTPGFQTDRVCTKDYTIQAKNVNEEELHIEEGISVLIPVAAIHRDSHYYEEPEKFDPERFSDENKEKILPGTYLPFGVGPRNCIGSRFALLQMKTLFFHLLSKFEIVPIEGTQVPLKINPKIFNLTAEKGFRVGFKPRPH